MKRYHEQEINPQASAQRSVAGKRPASTVHERSRLACDYCRKKKLKCSDQRPCESCRTKQLPCTVSSSSKPPGRPRHEARPVVNGSGPGPHAEALQESDNWPTPIMESMAATSLANSLSVTQTTLDNSSLASAGHDLNGLAPPVPQLALQPDGPNEILLNSSEDILPPSNSCLFDAAASVDPSWQDMGFMDTFWELPSLVSLTLSRPWCPY